MYLKVLFKVWSLNRAFFIYLYFAIASFFYFRSTNGVAILQPKKVFKKSWPQAIVFYPLTPVLVPVITSLTVLAIVLPMPEPFGVCAALSNCKVIAIVTGSLEP